TVEEHMQLSFSHIMKHWKRNPNQPGQAKIPEANSRKKKVYEQQENEENPLRCPVKLYEFYISKCPESVRTRNDVFYLQPERSCVPDSPVWYSTQPLSRVALAKMLHRVKMSCVPDSPVWYSTQPLSRVALAKMLHRVKMVKEINIALLTS
ncbi:WOC protein, partial [Operophtera brumata]